MHTISVVLPLALLIPLICIDFLGLSVSDPLFTLIGFSLLWDLHQRRKNLRRSLEIRDSFVHAYLSLEHLLSLEACAKPHETQRMRVLI